MGEYYMYLTSRQHDKLRSIVMNFEIPFRTFISDTLIKRYPTLELFQIALEATSIPEGVSQTFRSQIGKIKSQTPHIYNLMQIALKSMENKVVEKVVDVPDVATVIALILVFQSEFEQFIQSFSGIDLFMPQVEKYHYVRNKLSHPGCKTLEEQDLTLTLSFVSTACVFIGIEQENYFWDVSEDSLYQDIRSLETLELKKISIINNFTEMPLLERKIVCRDSEINDVKRYVYGVKGALRKKSSLCIYGYGGVGKTALVTESIKSIIQDVMDSRTINEYQPEYILFFTAKEEILDVSYTSGNIQKRKYISNFSTFEELKNNIFGKLQVNDFEGFHKNGIIIIDNLETLNEQERQKTKDFIDYMSPSEIQYIITSRNEEEYEERMHLAGFESEDGKRFIDEYIDENELDLQLSEEEKRTLLDISKGNTLVLVLSLRRLSKKIATVEGIAIDLSKSIISIETVENEFRNLPANGYEIISEFMFKNTFLELEKRLSNNIELFAQLMRIFAVFPSDSIDIYTLCMLMDVRYIKIEPYLNLLCRYFILERKNDGYSLNGFAEKYIIERFLPDKETYENLSMKVNKSIHEIQQDLKNLDKDLQNNTKVKDIINDWFITYDGDKIAAAKAYHLFQSVMQDCAKGNEYFVTNAYNDVKSTMEILEKTTMHPYIKYQKARMLTQIYYTNAMTEDISKEVIDTYIECIWIIKTNGLYTKIKSTKNYASVLWILGSFLSTIGDNERALHYLEEAYTCFEMLGMHDKEYYQCCSKLGGVYLNEYREKGNRGHLVKCKKLSDILYNERYRYMDEDQMLKNYATQLRNALIGQYSSLL